MNRFVRIIYPRSLKFFRQSHYGASSSVLELKAGMELKIKKMGTERKVSNFLNPFSFSGYFNLLFLVKTKLYSPAFIKFTSWNGVRRSDRNVNNGASDFRVMEIRGIHWKHTQAPPSY